MKDAFDKDVHDESMERRNRKFTRVGANLFYLMSDLKIRNIVKRKQVSIGRYVVFFKEECRRR